MLAIFETHPVQYHAPVYRCLAERHGVSLHVVYGSDFSVSGARDPDFGVRVGWGQDVLRGYSHEFLRPVAGGGPNQYAAVTSAGVAEAVARINPRAGLVLGHAASFNRGAWWQLFKRRIPILLRAEASDVDRPRQPARAAVRSLGLRLAYRHVDQVLYIGTRAREHYRAHGVPDERLVFSPYCVDTGPFRTAENDRQTLRGPMRAAWGVTDTDIVVLFSGKLTERKGVLDLVAAAARLPWADRAVLVWLGDGRLLGDVRARAAAQGVRSIFLGFRPQHQLSECFHASDCLALPSHDRETWGLVVNEGLHHGLPVVVSDRVGCAPDLVVEGRTGTIGAAGDVASLSAALHRARDLVGRPDVRSACRARVSPYSVEGAASGVAAAFSRLRPGRAAVA